MSKGSEATQFKGFGVGTAHRTAPTQVKLPDDLREYVNQFSGADRAEWLRAAVREKMERDLASNTQPPSTNDGG